MILLFSEQSIVLTEQENSIPFLVCCCIHACIIMKCFQQELFKPCFFLRTSKRAFHVLFFLRTFAFTCRDTRACACLDPDPKKKIRVAMKVNGCNSWQGKPVRRHFSADDPFHAKSFVNFYFVPEITTKKKRRKNLLTFHKFHCSARISKCLARKNLLGWSPPPPRCSETDLFPSVRHGGVQEHLQASGHDYRWGQGLELILKARSWADGTIRLFLPFSVCLRSSNTIQLFRKMRSEWRLECLTLWEPTAVLSFVKLQLQFAVTLKSTGSVPFRGFQVRAHRKTGDTESIVGHFLNDPSDGRSIYYYPQVVGTKVRDWTLWLFESKGRSMIKMCQNNPNNLP